MTRSNVVPIIHPRTLRGIARIFLSMTERQQDELMKVVGIAQRREWNAALTAGEIKPEGE